VWEVKMPGPEFGPAKMSRSKLKKEPRNLKLKPM